MQYYYASSTHKVHSRQRRQCVRDARVCEAHICTRFGCCELRQRPTRLKVSGIEMPPPPPLPPSPRDRACFCVLNKVNKQTNTRTQQNTLWRRRRHAFCLRWANRWACSPNESNENYAITVSHSAAEQHNKHTPPK